MPGAAAVTDAIELVTGSANATQPLQILEEDVDVTLKVVGRIAAGVLIVMLVALCIAVPLMRKKLKDKSGVPQQGGALRPYKIKECMYNFCCCGFCCDPCHQATGFDRLRPRVGEMLSLTFISATNLKGPLNFYFEVWTEPLEGYPRTSRIYKRANGNYDLGFERMELDWHGDETVLVINAVRYSGDKQSKDLPVAEIKIPSSSVLRYADEAKQSKGDMTQGCRVFSMDAIHAAVAGRRVQRVKGTNPLVAHGILPQVLTKISADNGVYVPSAGEVNSLRDENERLKKENEILKSQASGLGHTFSSTKKEGSPMSVAIRFEILPRTYATDGARVFKSSSFDEP